MSAEASSLRSPLTAQDADTLVSDALSARRGNALSNKLTSVLSSSYADTEIRDALRIYDARYGAQELTQDIDLKHEAQKRVIEGNARIVDDFSKVAKVCSIASPSHGEPSNMPPATYSRWCPH